MRTEDLIHATSLHMTYAILGICALGMVIAAVTYAMHRKNNE